MMLDQSIETSVDNTFNHYLVKCLNKQLIINSISLVLAFVFRTDIEKALAWVDISVMFIISQV